MNNRNKIQVIVEFHATKAQQSAYDRSTCVLAILKARETLMLIPDNVEDDEYPQQAIQQIDSLFQDYHDSDGTYTSGRGVIGSLLDDIRIEFSG